MLTSQLAGTATIVAALAVSFAGWRLGHRYGRAIEHQGIGRPYPLRHSALAFLGNALVLAGLIAVLMAVMLFFT